MKVLLQILKWSGIILFGLLSLLLALAGALFIWPEILINDRTLYWAMQKYFPPELEAQWSQLRIYVTSKTLLRKTVHLHAENFCIQVKDTLRGCLGELNFQSEVRWGAKIWIWPTVTFAELGTDGQLHFADRSRLVFNFNAYADAKEVRRKTPQYSLKGKYSRRGFSEKTSLETVQFKSQGELSLSHISGRISAQSTGWIEPIQQIELADCGFYLGQSSIEGREALRLECPVGVDLGLKSVQTSGVIEVQGTGDLADFPMKWKMKARTRLKSSLEHFEELVQEISEGPFPIPAPLHVLKGRGELALQGEGEFEAATVQIKLQTSLASYHQAFDLDTSGSVQWLKNDIPNLDLIVLLKNVQLELPRIEYNNIPRFIPDQRFKKDSKKLRASHKTAKPVLRYHIEFRTLPERPIRLISTMAQAHIPVYLDLVLTESSSIQGVIRIQKFPLEFFRRKAVVDHFTIHLKDPVGGSPLDGLVQMDFTDYQIMMKVSSIVDRPTIRFSSTPPLPENQLVAAVLFGRPIEDLNPDETASVGSTRAAIADGAVNLLSLVTLGSTPIQSVSYDATAGMLRAKFRVGEGTSLNLGTGAGESVSLGFRKRLGPFWSLETEVSSNPDTGRLASAYLVWSHRY